MNSLEGLLKEVDGFLSFETMAFNTQNSECQIRTRLILSNVSLEQFKSVAFWFLGSLKDESIPEGWGRGKLLVLSAYDVECKGYVTIESIYPDVESI